MSTPSRRLRTSPGAALALLTILVAAGCATASRNPAGAPKGGGRERTATLLAINDVYRIEGLDNGALGGMARVRSLRAELERAAPDLLVLHGGDFLFPSFASRMYRGEQMIAAMNMLDGDASAFDSRMFVTVGNHEFERGKMKDAAFVDSRIEASQFRWLVANVAFRKGADGAPLIAAPNLSRTALVESGGLKIGIVGIMIPTLGVEYVADYAGEQATAREQTAALRAQGADVVVALTHLNAANDRQILSTLGASGPDLIIGGHDHDAMAEQVGGRWLLKADADARSATVVRITKKADGTLSVAHELRTLRGNTPPPDGKVQALVDEWQARHAAAFCAEAKAAPGCLDEVYGRTRTDLGAEENKIRGRETSLGNWVGDRMLATFKECGAQAAFLNSGSLRLNRDLPKDTLITRRHIEELFAYATPLSLVKIDGATLAKVADQSVRGWPGSGSWLQVAGFGFRHDTANRVASALTWLGDGPPRPVAPGDTVLAVVGDYLINPEIGDQDGYQMLNRSQVVASCAANGVDLKKVMIDALRAAEPAGIAPVVDGRVCQGLPGTPCRLP